MTNRENPRANGTSRAGAAQRRFQVSASTVRAYVLILLAEGDTERSRLLCDWLQSEGHQVESAGDGRSVVDRWRLVMPDMLILAARLPGTGGVKVCREIRLLSDLPIILLGSDADIDGCVAGLDAGADDYLSPPLRRRELIARLRALARRARPAEVHELLQVGDLRVYTRQYRATLGDVDLPLRPQEYRLLLVLAGAPGVVFSSQRLMELAWHRPVHTATVGVHLTWLRRKLLGSNVRLENVRGRGFRLVVP
jgi:DNA-binding response OmpR family regulator